MNGKTTFCAQTALATAINNISDEAKILLPNIVNKILGLSPKKAARKQGLHAFEMDNAIKKCGLNSIIFDMHAKVTERVLRRFRSEYDWAPSSIFYPWVESGFPGLLVFRTQAGKHAVPVLGHTSNTDVWQPEADIQYQKTVKLHFRPVSAWVDNFIIHDDNFGMYFCYPTSKLAEKERRLGYRVDRAVFIMKDATRRDQERRGADPLSERGPMGRDAHLARPEEAGMPLRLPSRGTADSRFQGILEEGLQRSWTVGVGREKGPGNTFQALSRFPKDSGPKHDPGRDRGESGHDHLRPQDQVGIRPLQHRQPRGFEGGCQKATGLPGLPKWLQFSYSRQKNGLFPGWGKRGQSCNTLI